MYTLMSLQESSKIKIYKKKKMNQNYKQNWRIAT